MHHKQASSSPSLSLSLQAAVFSATFPVFDHFRKDYFIGELVWNFADFETAQSKWVGNG
jgi:beta-glucuronidase